MTWLLAIRTFLGSLPGAIIAALALLLVVQTVRIEGFKVWPIEVQGWKARALSAEQTSVEAAAQGWQADEVALARTAREREAVAAQNERARQAADDSDDPLAAALRELRGK
jgi:hypothetical protein